MLDHIANNDALILVARIFLMALFISTGWEKLTNFSATVGYMQTVKAPLPTIAAAIAVVMEFFVGIAIIIGISTRPLALAFAAFTLGTALLGHRFWTMDGEMRHENKINFLKNMSIIGGMLLLVVTGPGRFAIWP
ncbi:MAG TPA: DoxX family protein [Sphingomicrobium sp.]|nr:DoxX family protein [Sphingomicrobium sp.]